jgi:molecular chaperone DnaK (HSP70)
MRVILALVLLLLTLCAQAGIIVGVNIGSDSFKVATNKNSVVDVAINDQSKRRSPTILSFKNELERNIADSALQFHSRHPELSIQYLSDFLGESFDNTLVQQRLNSLYSSMRFRRDNAQRGIQICVDTECTIKYSPEELMGMVLQESARVVRLSFGSNVPEFSKFMISVRDLIHY